MIAMIGGIALFFLRGNFVGRETVIRNASIFLFLGGIIGGCFATPSRDMPNGMPGALPISLIFIVIGVYLVASPYIKKASGASANKPKKLNSKILLAIAIVIFAGFVAIAFTSSSSSSNSNEPWKELGVTKKEYMDVYNYYKYGNP